jgi:hypothetical protein
MLLLCITFASNSRADVSATLVASSNVTEFLNLIQQFTDTQPNYYKVTIKGPDLFASYDNYLYFSDNKQYAFSVVVLVKPFPCSYIMYKLENGDYAAFFPSKLQAVALVTEESQTNILEMFSQDGNDRMSGMSPFFKNAFITDAGNNSNIVSLEYDVDLLKKRGLLSPEIDQLNMEIHAKKNGQILKITQTIGPMVIDLDYKFESFDNALIEKLAPKIPKDLPLTKDKSFAEIMMEFQLNYKSSDRSTRLPKYN